MPCSVICFLDSCGAGVYIIHSSKAPGHPYIPAQYDAARHDTARHDTTIKCVFLCVHTNQGQKKERKRKKQTRRMGGNAVRVDLIWDGGERQKDGGGKGA
jgi:hypothetical protein